MKSVLLFAGMVVLLLAGVSIWQRLQDQSDRLLALARGGTMNAMQGNLLANSNVVPPRGPIAPEIVSDTWLNSAPLASGDLQGKVTVVEFWTFDCINCRNTIPQVRNWYDKYHNQGLVVIGVHSPELSFEYDLNNVKSAIQDLKIPYAVAIDNDFKNWNAFHVWAWPTVFILDKQGEIRFTHIGEGAYAEAEQTITALLKE
jgi:thiol-disulfide isomerase/thioredoxin